MGLKTSFSFEDHRAISTFDKLKKTVLARLYWRFWSFCRMNRYYMSMKMTCKFKSLSAIFASKRHFLSFGTLMVRQIVFCSKFNVTIGARVRSVVSSLFMLIPKPLFLEREGASLSTGIFHILFRTI